MKLYIVAGIIAGFLVVYALSAITGNAAAGSGMPILPNAAEPKSGLPEQEFYHAHADFKVFINGNEMDFAKEKYEHIDRNIHLHVNNPYGGYLLHLEGRKAPIGAFFSSLGMAFNSTCFSTETKSYCDDGTSALAFFVDGEQNYEYGDYVPQDMDRILITYGSAEPIKEQMDSVTSVACAFSGRCAIPQELEGMDLL